MPNPVEGLLEVYEDMVEVLLVLEIFLTVPSRLKPFLSQFSPSVAQIENFCSDPGFFLLNYTINLLQLGCLSDTRKKSVEIRQVTEQEETKD